MALGIGYRQSGLVLLACAVSWNTVLTGQMPPKPIPVSPSALHPVDKPASAAAHRAHVARGRARKSKVLPESVIAQDPQPTAAPRPEWPVNSKPAIASVGWDGRDLIVAATNSSLTQILRDISNATGVKVEGLGNDQRIFGSYGPAPARDVISQLLEGSGYNVLMIGDRGEGTPRQLVLTSKHGSGGGAPAPAAGQPGDEQDVQPADEEAPEDPEPPEQPPTGPPIRRPFGMPPQQDSGPTPQQMLQELQQRQELMQNLQPQPKPQN